MDGANNSRIAKTATNLQNRIQLFGPLVDEMAMAGENAVSAGE